MTKELYVSVPIKAIRDLGDHAVVSLGPGEEAIRLMMSAMSSTGKVAFVQDRLQVLCMEDEE